MAIIASQNPNTDFETVPAGVTAARCIDVVDLGMITTNYNGEIKTQHKIEIYWVTQHRNSENTFNLTVRQRYTLSLNENSNLYKDLVSWRSKPFTEEEVMGFDVENVIGAPCYINIIHNQAGDKTFANPTSIMPLPKEVQAPPIPEDYVRHVDRDEGGRDVRNPSKNEQGQQGNSFSSSPGQQPNTPQQQQPMSDDFAPDDDLPF